ncbi:unnamed protein product [Paramecium sonneborni]|uniref:Uncharacterized protein n=1 Tax=Paramecium sonneborni TaxID=65129 RepID=A0A8S1K991_9CILI|nr:unnamed protein product [Paramecium sonneborni]
MQKLNQEVIQGGEELKIMRMNQKPQSIFVQKLNQHSRKFFFFKLQKERDRIYQRFKSSIGRNNEGRSKKSKQSSLQPKKLQFYTQIETCLLYTNGEKALGCIQKLRSLPQRLTFRSFEKFNKYNFRELELLAYTQQDLQKAHEVLHDLKSFKIEIRNQSQQIYYDMQKVSVIKVFQEASQSASIP